jgi:hypothetical protein
MSTPSHYPSTAAGGGGHEVLGGDLADYGSPQGDCRRFWQNIQGIQHLKSQHVEGHYEGPRPSPQGVQRLRKRRKVGPWVIGKCKRYGRRIGERVASLLQQIIKVVPNHPVATPVLGAVNLLMNVRSLHPTSPPHLSLLPAR